MEDKTLLQRLWVVYFFLFASAPITYLIRIFYARTLSIEAYGLFYSIISFLLLISIFNDFGLQSALTHYIPKFIKNRENNKIKSAVYSLFSVQLFLALLISITLLSLNKFLSNNFFQTSLSLKIIPIFAFLFITNSTFVTIQTVFKGFRKEMFYSSMNPLRLLIVFIFSFFLAQYYKQDLLFLFSIIWVTSFLFISMFYYLPLSKLLPKKPVFSFDKKILKILFGYGKFVMIGSVAAVIFGKVDVLMLTYFKGVSEVAFYEVALPIASIILLVTQPLNAFLFPQISHFYHTKQFNMIKSVIKLIYTNCFFFFLPAGLVFVIFPEEIILLLFGSKFLMAKVALQVLAMGFIFKGLSLLNFMIADGIGQVKKKSVILYVGLILNIILNFLLIPNYSLTGAAIATTISFFLMFVLSTFFIFRVIKISFPYKNWIKIIINSILFVILIQVLKTVINLNLYLESLIVVSISILIYLLIGFKWKIINYKNIRDILVSKIG